MKQNHQLLDEIAKRGYTVKAFCDKCETDPSTIYHYIDGRKKGLSNYTINTIAVNLGMPYEDVKRMCPTRYRI